jgi:hypothetical protein
MFNPPMPQPIWSGLAQIVSPASVEIK